MTDWLSALFALLIFPGFGFLLICGLAFQWIDRSVAARLQGRVGPPCDQAAGQGGSAAHWGQ